jgi:hypothetical protein
MKTLPKEITIGSGANQFTYRELIRKGMHAIYEQWQFGKLVAYEVFRIMSHDGFQVKNATTGQVANIDPAESMPSGSAWGIHGFTYSAQSHKDPKSEAIKRLVRMVNKV